MCDAGMFVFVGDGAYSNSLWCVAEEEESCRSVLRRLFGPVGKLEGVQLWSDGWHDVVRISFSSNFMIFEVIAMVIVIGSGWVLEGRVSWVLA